MDRDMIEENCACDIPSALEIAGCPLLRLGATWLVVVDNGSLTVGGGCVVVVTVSDLARRLRLC